MCLVHLRICLQRTQRWWFVQRKCVNIRMLLIQSFVVIAIAAKNEKGQFTPTPITPCGACRQVLIETQHRYNHPLRLLLYGANRVYCLDSVSDLLPFQFDADAL